MTWSAIAALVVGPAHAVVSWFFFSRRRHGAGWALGWLAATLAAVLLQDVWAVQVGFWAAVVVWEAWWLSLRPQIDRDWAPDVARQSTGIIAGGRLVMHDVRNFVWRGEEDHLERWETRSYDINKLESLDLFAVYWTIEGIAHLIMSFGFGEEGRLAFSIEIRRERGEPWSGIRGAFKVFELVTIAADERDVLGVRAGVRGEDVRIYRLRTTAEFRKKLLAQYVADCNLLAKEPRFFHTFWTNCTTQVVRMARAAGWRLPFDWRMIASGHVPDYLYKVGLLDRRVSFAELRGQASVSEKVRAAGYGAGFSQKIREGVPRPEDEAG